MPFLTDKSVAALSRKAKAEGKRIQAMDTGYTFQGVKRRGFGARFGVYGAGTWFARYTIEGQSRRATLGHYPGMGLAEARRHADEIYGKVERGVDPLHERRIQPTVEELADEYFKHIESRLRTWKRRKWQIERYVLPHWRGRKAHEIGRADVTRLLRGIVDGHGTQRGKPAPVMANRVLGAIRAMFSWGLEHEDLLMGLMEYNPAWRVRAQPEKPSERVLSLDEIKLL
ncbi:MAG: integrase arm-type DNA-binding domain-containing protein, partial [Acidobacteriota bacterium]